MASQRHNPEMVWSHRLDPFLHLPLHTAGNVSFLSTSSGTWAHCTLPFSQTLWVPLYLSIKLLEGTSLIIHGIYHVTGTPNLASHQPF